MYWKKDMMIDKLLRKIARRKPNINKTKDTKPERMYEALLIQSGTKYIKQFQIDRCHVDFFLPASKTVVEVYGCFAHQCYRCGFRNGAYGMTAQQKHEADERRIKFLQSKGYIVKVVWQHELERLVS